MNDYFKDTFIALDLEMNQPSNRIIQIGAAIGTYKDGDPIETFSAFINPFEVLDPRIIELTGITQDQVNNQGVNLGQGFDLLLTFMKDKGVFINPVTWGGADGAELEKQLVSYPISPCGMCWGREPTQSIFGHRWLDAKTLYAAYRIANGRQPSGGLSRAMTHLGLAFKGRKHNAMDDAYNTLVMFRKMVSFYHGREN